MQALKVKTMSKEGKKEIESFTHVLSHMSSTLKVTFRISLCPVGGWIITFFAPYVLLLN